MNDLIDVGNWSMVTMHYKEETKHSVSENKTQWIHRHLTLDLKENVVDISSAILDVS